MSPEGIKPPERSRGRQSWQEFFGRFQRKSVDEEGKRDEEAERREKDRKRWVEVTALPLREFPDINALNAYVSDQLSKDPDKRDTTAPKDDFSVLNAVVHEMRIIESEAELASVSKDHGDDAAMKQHDATAHEAYTRLQNLIPPGTFVNFRA